MTGRAHARSVRDMNNGLAYWPEQRADAAASRRQVSLRVLATAAIAITAAAAAAGAALAAGGSGTNTQAVGAFDAVRQIGGLRVEIRDSPNRASKAGTISVALSKKGEPIEGAQVRVTLTMLDMDMGSLSAPLPQAAPGRYQRSAPILGMGGHWRIALDIKPGSGKRLHLAVVDRMAP
jgi:hypothetical protein